MLRDLSPAAVSAGFVATLVGFTSTIALIFHAARSLGATPEQVSSWVLALGLGMGLTTIGLSLWQREPILITWSTPGAAVIASAATGISLGEATGAFLVCGVLMLLCGVTRWFERIMDRIPVALASALLAGILAKFALMAFAGGSTHPALVVTMLVTYLVGKRWWPRYAVLGVLVIGTGLAAAQGLLNTHELKLSWAQPVWVTPQWSWHAVIGMGLPLFIVTMASQAVPGVSAIRVSGYAAPVSPLMSWSGVATILLAPFGGYTFNLAAITAAIVLSPHAHTDKAKRYTAAVMAGLFYIAMGVLGGAVAGLLNAFPSALIMGVAGMALLGTIASGLAASLREDRFREAALITFLVTLSGVTLLGVGSAFWGLVAGTLTLFVENFHTRPTNDIDSP
ncbi:MAG: benzoate transporter BenE [Aquabacterium sp.]|uniref:benzoate/H(+) symporter BenE family transporter n=1 Tax=Aquabacterium sp. TaxID=1872578 RepID=UPI0011F4A5A6|nr:benzoate/H(+) symporter BenE family transporter [Aquabacterium sp.]TAK94942.1 MAG: benzoate transporter BenE [Aquabacterium sp.]